MAKTKRLKRRKWYSSRVKPDVSDGLIIMTDMGYVFEAIYVDGKFKASIIENSKVYFVDYDHQESIVKWLKF